MEMCYVGAIAMPSSYAVMDEEEMTYVEGGGVHGYYIKFSLTEWLARAAVAGGVGALTGVVCTALGATGVGLILIPLVAGVLGSYFADKTIEADTPYNVCVYNTWSFKNKKKQSI